MPVDTVLARLAAALREKRLRDQLTQSEALVLATAIERCGFELQQWLGRELPEGEAGEVFDMTPATVPTALELRRQLEQLEAEVRRAAADQLTALGQWEEHSAKLAAERDAMRAALERIAASKAATRERRHAVDAAVQLGDRLRGASVRRVDDADPEAP